MIFIIGFVVVFGSVFVGYIMHSGDLALLFQLNEWVIIIGSGIGSVLISSSWKNIIQTLRSCKYLFIGINLYNKDDYSNLLITCFNTFKLMKSKGMLEIESHIENPESSSLFANATSLKKENYMYNFMQDNLRMIIMGVDNPYQFEDLINKEIEVYEETNSTPSKLMLSLADTLPALGIVAAVLGVIMTMRSIAEPPEVLGSLIAAALAGTFTGILLSYGLVGPIGYALAKHADYKTAYLECIKVGFIAYLNGNPPIVIVEYMRKCIPEESRPDFFELDSMIHTESIK